LPLFTVFESPIPPDLTDEYAGRWVAIRDGEVVGSDDELEDLVRQDGVREDDLLYRVPHISAAFY
jgi:hypothetical protein